MGADYPGAEWMPIPGFGYDPQGSHGREGHSAKWIIVHKTASPNATAQNIATYFQGDPNNGTHFVIGRDGAVIQMVALADAAYGNAPVNPAKHDAFWDSIGSLNPNFVTVSIEHCTTTSDNSDALTPEQQDASFKLIAWLCKTLNIPARAADANGGVTGHFSLDGINRAHCPGNYPFDALFSYLGGAMQPQGPFYQVTGGHNGVPAVGSEVAAAVGLTWDEICNIPGNDHLKPYDPTGPYLFRPSDGYGVSFLLPGFPAPAVDDSALKQQIATLQSSLAAEQADNAKLTALVQQLEATPNDLQSRLEACQQALDTANQELALLKAQEPSDPVALQQRAVSALEAIAQYTLLTVPAAERPK